MEQLTTYTIKSKNSSNIWIFKYHLNGVLESFKALDGILTQRQVEWLFIKGKFPHQEQHIKDWQKNLKANFEITVGEPDLSFEALWRLYDHKIKRFESEKAFNKMKPADVIRCFQMVKYYDNYVAKTKVGKAHLSTFINKRYFEDEWQKV
jgi:hypothetical protein